MKRSFDVKENPGTIRPAADIKLRHYRSIGSGVNMCELPRMELF